LIARTGGIQLLGPNTKTDLTATGAINRAELAADSSRILYDQISGGQIRVIEAVTGSDRLLATGQLPALAQDGRTFSYLSAGDNSTQVWLGDALNGSVHVLSHEAEGIIDQTISGNGLTVIAATSTGRLLSIDTVSGAITQLLDATGSVRAGLLSAAVPGSYNVITGTLPPGLPPDVRVGNIPAVILGSLANGSTAIQVPWEAVLDPQTAIAIGTSEPLFEQLIGVGVFPVAGAALPVGALGPDGPAY
jgi:hypothetical protein